MPQQLIAGHTHLYTEESIKYFCNEFSFNIKSEWWFGLDILDLFRSTFISLKKSENDILNNYWKNKFYPLIDDLQNILGKNKACSEVHMLLEK